MKLYQPKNPRDRSQHSGITWLGLLPIVILLLGVLLLASLITLALT